MGVELGNYKVVRFIVRKRLDLMAHSTPGLLHMLSMLPIDFSHDFERTPVPCAASEIIFKILRRSPSRISFSSTMIAASWGPLAVGDEVGMLAALCDLDLVPVGERYTHGFATNR